ncbi:MAG: DUF6531 domain-containing protein, partial [Acidimicrobiales bacterium]
MHADYFSSNGYVVILLASSYYLLPGQTTDIYAFSCVEVTTNYCADISTTPYEIQIFAFPGAKLAGCFTGTYCELSWTEPEGYPQDYSPVLDQFVAAIGSDSADFPPPNVQAESNPISVNWDLSELVGGSNPAESPVSCETTWGVSCASGNFYHSFPELSVPGRGVPLSFSMSYNSEGTATSANGGGLQPNPGPYVVGALWTDNYDMYLIPDFDGAGGVLIYQENGSTLPFYYNFETGGYTPYPEVQATLTAGPGGTFDLVRNGELVTYEFNSFGRLIDEVDFHDYVTSLTYDSLGQLSTVTDPEGRTMSFYYYTSGPGNGYLGLVLDPAGAEAAIYYATVTTPNGHTANEPYLLQDPLMGVTSFAYSSTNSTHLAGIVDPNGSSLATVYDCPGICQAGDGRSESIIYNDTGGTAIIDPNGDISVAAHSSYLLDALARGYG